MHIGSNLSKKFTIALPLRFIAHLRERVSLFAIGWLTMTPSKFFFNAAAACA